MGRDDMFWKKGKWNNFTQIIFSYRKEIILSNYLDIYLFEWKVETKKSKLVLN